MLIIIISRSSLKLGHVGSKTRLLGQQATQVRDLGALWPSCFFFSFFFFFFCFGVGAVVICSHTVDVKILCSDVVRPSGCPFIF